MKYDLKHKANATTTQPSPVLMRAFAELSSDALIACDSDGRILECNPASEHIFGLERDTIVGHCVFETVAPRDQVEEYKILFEAFLELDCAASVAPPSTLLARRSDGGDFPAEIAFAKCDTHPNPTFILSVRDLSSQHEANEQARQALHSLDQLLSISLGIVGLDGEGVVTRWNNAAEYIFEVDADSVVGRSLLECPIPWCDPEVPALLLASYLTDDSTSPNEIDLRTADENERTVEITRTPLLSPSGSSEGLILLARDVTERKTLEDQLQRSRRLESIGQLSAGIAHEINTPIQFVGDNIRFLGEIFEDLVSLCQAYDCVILAAEEQAPRGDLIENIKALLQKLDIEYLTEEVPKAVEQSLDGVGRVATIVRAMKEFSHPGEKEKVAVDLNRAIASTITISRNEWKYVAELKTDFDKTLPAVPCYPQDLNQVILNLIVNASHAIEDSIAGDTSRLGVITVTTRCDGGQVTISVSDTGTGIPASIRSKIFDPFFTTKDVGKGTGQGLALAHGIVVDKHGGDIRVDSTEGVGTTFHLSLPLNA